MWGVYPFKHGATGRWEWHWSWSSGGGAPGYPGSDWYNPFTGPNGYACNAPVGKYPGGFLYKSVFLTAADGITDYAYIHTLQRAVARHKAAKTKPDVVRQADAFLKALAAAVPEFPGGQAEEKAAHQLDAWRARMAGLIVALR